MKPKESNQNPVVFFAHFKSEKIEAYRMAKYECNKDANDFFTWVQDELNKLNAEHNKIHIITNCGIIR